MLRLCVFGLPVSFKSKAARSEINVFLIRMIVIILYAVYIYSISYKSFFSREILNFKKKLLAERWKNHLKTKKQHASCKRAHEGTTLMHLVFILILVPSMYSCTDFFPNCQCLHRSERILFASPSFISSFLNLPVLTVSHTSNQSFSAKSFLFITPSLNAFFYSPFASHPNFPFFSHTSCPVDLPCPCRPILPKEL